MHYTNSIHQSVSGPGSTGDSRNSDLCMCMGKNPLHTPTLLVLFLSRYRLLLFMNTITSHTHCSRSVPQLLNTCSDGELVVSCQGLSVHSPFPPVGAYLTASAEGVEEGIAMISRKIRSVFKIGD